MKQEKVFTKNRSGEKLVGVKVTPDIKKEKYPVVIRIHGFGSSKDVDGTGFAPVLAEALASVGIITYYFDLSGCGESEGDYIETTLTKQVKDFESFLEYVSKDPTTDINNIGILGNSLGAAVVIAANVLVKCIVLSGSTYNYYEDIKGSYGTGFNPKGLSERLKSDGRTIIKIGPQFWSDLKKYDLIKLIKQINVPILFLQGEKDTTTPVEEMEKLFRAANEPKEKYILKDSDHKLNPRREEAIRVIVRWFKKQLILTPDT